MGPLVEASISWRLAGEVSCVRWQDAHPPQLNMDQFSDLSPPVAHFPAELRETISELRATAAGAHAIRVYAAYRGAKFDRAAGRVLPRAGGSSNYKVKFRLPRGTGRNNLAALGAAGAVVVAVPLAGVGLGGGLVGWW